MVFTFELETSYRRRCIAVQDGDGSREAEGADHSDPEERVLEEGDRLEQRERDVRESDLGD